MSDTPTLTGEILTGDNDKQEVNYLDEFVGEGKRYATIEEAAPQLAKKAKHADEFINTLKNEKAQLAQELKDMQTKAKTAEDLLVLLKQDGTQYREQHDGEQTQTPQTSSSLTKEETVALMREILSQNESVNQKKQAFENAKTYFHSAEGFGSEEETRAAMKKFIEKDPVNKTLIDTIGLTNPKRLVELIKADVVTIETFSPERTATIPIPSGVQPNQLTWEQAQKIKRENPAKYRSASFQKALQTAMDKNPNFMKK